MDADAGAKKERKKKKSKKKSNQSSVAFCIVGGDGAVKEVIKKDKKRKGETDKKKEKKKKRRKDADDAAAPATVPAPAAAAPTPAAAPPAKTKTADNPTGATRLFMGNLPWSITDDQLGEACGCELKAIKRITDKESGKFYGSVFVEASDAAAAGAAVKRSGQDVGGRPVKIAFAPPRPGDVWPPRGNDSQTRQKETVVREKTPRPTDGTLKLFIGNVAYEATDSDVRKLFEPVAPIRGVRWVTHKHSGEFKGCGYLSFHSCEETDAALEQLDGAELCGRRIRLDYTE